MTEARLRARLSQRLVGLLALPLVVVRSRFRRGATRPEDQLFVWGPVPILNNRYWSQAVTACGRRSVTLMATFYDRINRRADFDLYYDDLLPRWVRSPRLRAWLAPWAATAFILGRAAVVHIPYSGGPLGSTPWWRWESRLYSWFGVRSVVIAYGADFYRYSRISDLSLRHALQLSYPQAARHEAEIDAHVRYWERHADIVLPGMGLDAAGRWDVLTPQVVCIDEREWPAQAVYTDSDGRSGTVRVVHTPNHRGFKGTEFVTRAVEQLRAEGLAVELLLIEGMQNHEVRDVLAQADILVEQLIFTGYALSGEEGMASGLPVIANLDREDQTRVFRRWSFLNDCPILSATPETVTDALRLLVTTPSLRRALGTAGREYIERYHSIAAAGELFEAIYARVLDGADVDLLRLYDPHPRDSRRPAISHPLVENRWPGRPPAHPGASA